jgi:hypothetical protein
LIYVPRISTAYYKMNIKLNDDFLRYCNSSLHTGSHPREDLYTIYPIHYVNGVDIRKKRRYQKYDCLDRRDVFLAEKRVSKFEDLETKDIISFFMNVKNRSYVYLFDGIIECDTEKLIHILSECRSIIPWNMWTKRLSNKFTIDQLKIFSDVLDWDDMFSFVGCSSVSEEMIREFSDNISRRKQEECWKRISEQCGKFSDSFLNDFGSKLEWPVVIRHLNRPLNVELIRKFQDEFEESTYVTYDYRGGEVINAWTALAKFGIFTSTEIITEFADFLPFNDLVRYQKVLTEEFVVSRIPKMTAENWIYFSEYFDQQNLSDGFIKDYKDKIVWTKFIGKNYTHDETRSVFDDAEVMRVRREQIDQERKNHLNSIRLLSEQRRFSYY